MAKVTAAAPMPICTGEFLHRRHGFQQLIQEQACDMLHVDVSGTGGMLEADITHGKLIAHVKGEQQVLLEEEKGKQTENEMAHFLDCIESGRPPLTDGPGSLQGLRVIWRLYEAAKEQRVADLRGLGLDET